MRKTIGKPDIYDLMPKAPSRIVFSKRLNRTVQRGAGNNNQKNNIMKMTLKASYLACALLLVSGGILSVRAQYSPPTAGLVAWWRAEGNANDSADSHHGFL